MEEFKKPEYGIYMELYSGKDILGSVRSVSDEKGRLEDRYEYDAFGKPYRGDLEGTMNLGYMSKPYNQVTGLYNYGFRDYKASMARFSTSDPIRDGTNWYVYVNNDPVNYVDLWGLKATDSKKETEKTLTNSKEQNLLAQGFRGVAEIIGGGLIFVGSAGAGTATAPTVAGAAAGLAGMGLGGGMVADGIQLLTEAIMGRESESVLDKVIGATVFSAWDDVGKGLQK